MDKFKFGNYLPPTYYEFEENNDRHSRNPKESAAYEARGGKSLYAEILTSMVKTIRFTKLDEGTPSFDSIVEFRRARKKTSSPNVKESEKK